MANKTSRAVDGQCRTLVERGEADRALIKGKRSVDVLHKAIHKLVRHIRETDKERGHGPVAKKPDVVAETDILSNESTNAVAVVVSLPEVEAAEFESVALSMPMKAIDSLRRGDSPSLATPVEADSWERVTRVRVVTLLRVIYSRSRNSSVERLDLEEGEWYL